MDTLRAIDMEENVRTIDSWQGRECDYIIFSCVRSNLEKELGFLANARRINVALTRAKHGMIIVGNATTLCHDPNWKFIIDFCKENKVYCDGLLSAGQYIRSKYSKGPTV
jgi:regulator of nonsense transcripts 1